MQLFLVFMLNFLALLLGIVTDALIKVTVG